MFFDLIKNSGFVDASQRMMLVSAEDLIILSRSIVLIGKVDDFNFICIAFASTAVITKSSSFLDLQLVIASDMDKKHPNIMYAFMIMIYYYDYLDLG